MPRFARFVTIGMAAFLTMGGASGAHPRQHGSDDGHLVGTGDWGKIQLVGQEEVLPTNEGQSNDELIADVAGSTCGDRRGDTISSRMP